MQTFKMLIDRRRVESESGRRIDGENTYSGEIWATIPRGTVGDVDAAVEAAHWAVQGVWKTFVAGSKMLLQRCIADKFVEQLVNKTQKIALGDPLDAASQMGPMANRPQLEKVLDYFKIAKSGHGRDNGIEAINEFLQTKSICINSDPGARNPFIVSVG